MNKMLSQQEIDALIEALNNFREYSDAKTISTDILNGQVVLSQAEIDKLIASLSIAKDIPINKPNVNVSLTQPEIDSLIDALTSIKEYGKLDDLSSDISTNQSVLSQAEIDELITKLLTIKDNSAE